MKARTLIPLLVGLGVGFFAIKLGIDKIQEARSNQGDQVEVAVSARSIEVATRIGGSMLSTKSVPQSLLPEDAFTNVEALEGRVTRMSVAKGVPITEGMLAPPGSHPGLRARIPPGFRAVSISVTEESAVAGFVMPGSRVDVYSGGRSGQSKLILSDVEIGAVGQSLSEVGKDGKTVRMTKSITLFLTPEQVLVLNSYASVGRKNLRLALRGHQRKLEDPGEPFWSQILAKALEQKIQPAPDEELPLPKAKPAQKHHVVELVRGSEVERFVFVETGVPGQYRPVGDLARFEKEMGGGFGDPEDTSSAEMNE